MHMLSYIGYNILRDHLPHEGVAASHPELLLLVCEPETPESPRWPSDHQRPEKHLSQE